MKRRRSRCDVGSQCKSPISHDKTMLTISPTIAKWSHHQYCIDRWETISRIGLNRLHHGQTCAGRIKPCCAIRWVGRRYSSDSSMPRRGQHRFGCAYTRSDSKQPAPISRNNSNYCFSPFNPSQHSIHIRNSNKYALGSYAVRLK